MSEPIIPTTPPVQKREPERAPELEISRPQGNSSIDDAMSIEVDELVQQTATDLAASLVGEVAGSLEDKTLDIIFLDAKLADALGLFCTFQSQCVILLGAFESAEKMAKDTLDQMTTVQAFDVDLGRLNLRQLNMDQLAKAKLSSTLEYAQAHNLSLGAVDFGMTGGLTAAANLLGLFAVDTEYKGSLNGFERTCSSDGDCRCISAKGSEFQMAVSKLHY